MTLKRILLLSLLLLPLQTFAATEVPAGFAPGILWLSKEPVYAGETIKISAVLYNNSEKIVSGDLVFLDGATSIGSLPFSLPKESSQIFSLTWTATEGTHSFSAEIKSDTAGLPQNKVKTAAVITETLAPLPQEPERTEALVDHSDSTKINQYIANKIPTIAPVVQKVLSASDSLRDMTVSSLASDIDGIKKQMSVEKTKATSTPSSGTGTSTALITKGEEKDNTDQTASPFLSSWRFILQMKLAFKSIVYYIFKNIFLFYSTIILLTFFLSKMIFRCLFEKRPI